MVGISPARASLAEGIAEVLTEEPKNAITGRSIEVSGDDDGRQLGVDVGFFQLLEGEGDFHPAPLAVVAVSAPAIPPPEAEIGGGGLEVHVLLPHFSAISSLSGKISRKILASAVDAIAL